MGWEQRGNYRYYYRSVGHFPHRRKICMGRGPAAEKAAREDEAARKAKAELKNVFAPLKRRVQSTGNGIESLLAVELCLAGWIREHREWKSPPWKNV